VKRAQPLVTIIGTNAPRRGNATRFLCERSLGDEQGDIAGWEFGGNQLSGAASVAIAELGKVEAIANV
jgi:hypothetical protein